MHAEERGLDEQQVAKLAKKIQQRGPEGRSRSDSDYIPDFREPVPIGKRRKSKKRGVLTV